MPQVLGYSTGALAGSDFRRALNLLQDQPVKAVELSAIRSRELIPLLRALDTLDLSKFEYISIHAPSEFSFEDESWIFEELNATRGRGWPVVVHPDTLLTHSPWGGLGDLLCIENMDQRKKTGRTVRELKRLFEMFPRASFCFDIGHARQVDTSMVEAFKMLREFGPRLRQVHVSEVNTRNKHDPLSFVSILDFQEVAALIPSCTPIIIESIVSEGHIATEIARVQRALTADIVVK
jgi:hypothetical protein